MTHDVERPPAPADTQERRAPALPQPPQFDESGDEPTRQQLIGDEFAPKLGEQTSAQDDAVTTEVPAPAESAADSTKVMPAGAAGPDESIFRAGSVATPAEAEPSAEERKLAAERAARREAREQALAGPDVQPVAAADPIVVTRRSTDRFLGSLALFLLRLVVAGILAVRGLEIVTNLPAAEAVFASTVIPYPQIMAMVTGVAALAIAVALVFGLLTRVAGLGVALIAGGVLAFVLWGNWSPFVPGRTGFIGEYELLLATVGVLFLCVGGGGFSLDRSFRKSREKDRLLDQGL